MRYFLEASSRRLGLFGSEMMSVSAEKDASRLGQHAGAKREHRHGYFLSPEWRRARLYRTLEEGTALQLALRREAALDSPLRKVRVNIQSPFLDGSELIFVVNVRH